MAETDKKKKADWTEFSSEEEKSHKSKSHSPASHKSQGENQGSFQRNERPKRPQLSKEETIEKIRMFKGTVIMNLINVDYGATEADIEKLYAGATFNNIEIIKKGMFTCVMPNAAEALKLIECEEKKIKGRPIKATLGRPKRREFDNEKREGNYNKERRPPMEQGYNRKFNDSQGRYNNNKYNRKESDNNEESNDFFNKNSSSNYKQNYNKNYEKPRYDNHNQTENHQEQSEMKPSEPKKPFGFTRGAPKEIKKEDPNVAKVVKSNPFGSAKARDEILIQKKRIEENKENPLAEPEIKEVKGAVVEKVEVPQKAEIVPPKEVKVEKEEEEIIVKGKNKKNLTAPKVENKSVPTEAEKSKPKAKATGNVFDKLGGANDDSD